MPAFFNGVFGHKPTGGLVPNSGQYPLGDTAQGMRYVTTGPICRSADDLYPLLSILAGPDGEDPGCRPLPLQNPDTVSMKGQRVVVVPGMPSFPRADPALIDAQRAAADALADEGAIVEEIEIKELEDALAIWSAMLGDSQVTRFAETIGIESVSELLGEVLRKPLGRSKHTLPALLLALADTPLGDRVQNQEAFISKGRKLRGKLEDIMGPDGVILYPPHAVLAPRHHTSQIMALNWVYTAILNVMEFPVTQVPLGLQNGHLPLGVQVIGPFGQDHVTISVAKRLEQLLGGWVCTPRSRRDSVFP
jgi:fatty acid amide hydrolase 2